MSETNDNIVEFKNISKRFPGVVALDGISFAIRRASCHAIVGENGAGKSTLGKMLAGIHTPTSGEIWIAGQRVYLQKPRDALDAGIGMVHQELAFCENLSVAENLCLGQTPRRGPWVDQARMYRDAHAMLSAIGAKFDVRQPVSVLTVAQQQMVQIAGAVARGARILIFDEPTSSLSEADSLRLFKLIQTLQKTGVTSIYVSHRLEEIFRLCDTVTVLRDGQLVATTPTTELNEGILIRQMIGRPFEAYFPTHLTSKTGEELLRVENLSSPGKFKDVSFALHAGEILGLAGLVGAGRTEIAQAIFGIDRLATGKIFVEGREVLLRNPAKAMQLGIGLVPEDRKRHGLVLSMNARENISLPTLEQLATAGWVKSEAERNLVQRYFSELDIRAAGMDTPALGLSGGNQQKLALAKWLAAQCRILLVDEPTRGVDVGAKAEIHALLDQLARRGTGILLISSELPEIINLATRILVLRHGRLSQGFEREEASQELLMRSMAGIERNGDRSD